MVQILSWKIDDFLGISTEMRLKQRKNAQISAVKEAILRELNACFFWKKNIFKTLDLLS